MKSANDIPAPKTHRIARTARKLIACISVLFFLILLAPSCSKESAEPTEIKHYPLDTLEGVITQSGTRIDTSSSSDGKGCLCITATQPTTVRLFETGDLDVEDARLTYQAMLRTENVKGRVYLEMWCNFPGKGEFFSRAVQSALTGTNDWCSQETPFFLKNGENPDNIKLNLVIDGEGTACIDDIRLMKGPLR